MSVGQKAWNKFGELVVKFLRLTSLVKSPLKVRYEINSYAKSIAKGIRSGEAKQQNFPETDDQVIGKPTPPDNKKTILQPIKRPPTRAVFSLSTMPKNEAEISGKGMTKPEAALVAKQWLRQFKTDINVAVVKDQAEFESALADRGFTLTRFKAGRWIMPHICRTRRPS